MKKSKRTDKSRSSAKHRRGFRAGVFACILLAACAVTAIAKYERGSVEQLHVKQGGASTQPASNYVTVEVGGKRLKVNAQTLQQGPLTQEQSREIADALKDNKSTDGLVEVKQADGTVSVDLQGRFQNVMVAKKNEDGSVSEACVDNSKAATEFFKSGETTSGGGATRKAASKE
jgi:hypothetical protein